jgi:hypothetical protein
MNSTAKVDLVDGPFGDGIAGLSDGLEDLVVQLG